MGSQQQTCTMACTTMQGRYLRIPLRQVMRYQSTVSVAQDNATQMHDTAKPFSEMPSPPAWPVIGHLPLVMGKKNNMDKMFERLRESHGDIFKVYVPGQGNMVVIFRPEDIKTLYSNDGHIPNIPGFDMLEFVRKTSLKSRYETTGLINNSEDWYDVRSKVQQDMMRPKSALYYIDEMEAIGCVFMGTRLGALKEIGDGKQLIENQKKSMAMMMTLFLTPTWIAPYLPIYKKCIGCMAEAFDIC